MIVFAVDGKTDAIKIFSDFSLSNSHFFVFKEMIFFPSCEGWSPFHLQGSYRSNPTSGITWSVYIINPMINLMEKFSLMFSAAYFAPSYYISVILALFMLLFVALIFQIDGVVQSAWCSCFQGCLTTYSNISLWKRHLTVNGSRRVFPSFFSSPCLLGNMLVFTCISRILFSLPVFPHTAYA